MRIASGDRTRSTRKGGEEDASLGARPSCSDRLPGPDARLPPRPPGDDAHACSCTCSRAQRAIPPRLSLGTFRIPGSMITGACGVLTHDRSGPLSSRSRGSMDIRRAWPARYVGSLRTRLSLHARTSAVHRYQPLSCSLLN